MTTTGLSLLVVDDSRVMRDLFASQLGSRGYQVTAVGSGPEALESLAKEHFDLVLLDVEMPTMNGLELLSIIRQTHSIGELPVIMVTGRDQNGDMIAAFHLGASDYVTKPLNLPVTLARIQAHTATRVTRAAQEPPSTSSRPGSGGKSTHRMPVAKHTAAQGPGTPGGPGRGAELLPSVGERPGESDNPGAQEIRSVAGATALATANQVIAGYEVLGELGRGGMGVVYKARHHRMDRLVALKVIEKQFLASPDAVQRFYQEARAVAQLCHPNIVLAYDAGEVDDTHYLAMEYIDGTDLARLVKQNGPLPVSLACDFVRQAALGLQHAHERGLVHRDIKPSNMLVTFPVRAGGAAPVGTPSGSGGIIKVLDLGMALLMRAPEAPAKPTHLTHVGGVHGTADYMAPEQWVNAHTVDIRADLYSLGCTFYFLLTGCVPFPGDQPMEKMLKHHFDEPAPLEESRPDVPPHVIAIVRRLLAKRPQDRYDEPAKLAEALQ
jgi:CheY-like chemotaxis protein